MIKEVGLCIRGKVFSFKFTRHSQQELEDMGLLLKCVPHQKKAESDY